MSKKVPFKLVTAQRSLVGPAGVAAVIAMVLGLAAVAWFAFTVRVPPDAFAVRQVYLGPNQGVHRDIYGPGLHLVVPGYERLHLFPRDIQTLDMNEEETGWVRTDTLHGPAIRIQTSEGYQVTVDVTVLYRLVDPYLVLSKVGAGKLYETKIVQRRADKILRQTLGELEAEDFYSDRIRMQKGEQARALLSQDLAEWGIEVWSVLVRSYNYDDRYQDAIEQRKIQDQKVFKNQAEAIAASREAEKNRVLAEGQANIGVEQERGRAEVRKINAEADLYFRQRVAEGDLLVALAEAEGTKLENNALQQAGAANIVGLEMAKALEGTEVIIVSTTGPGAVNPLDLDSLVEGW